MKKLVIAFITALTIFTSCKKDGDNQTGNRSRTLKYEVTGNFSGSNIIVSYTTASGGTVVEQPASIPWSKEITYDASVGGASMVISGAGGAAGQQVTMIIKRGGNAVGSPVTATTNAGGTFTMSSPVITF